MKWDPLLRVVTIIRYDPSNFAQISLDWRQWWGQPVAPTTLTHQTFDIQERPFKRIT